MSVTSSSAIALGILVVACGGQAQTDPLDFGAEPSPEPMLNPTAEDQSDPILNDPQLSAGVTSVLQPSYFSAAAEDPGTAVYANGATLEGSGDLTLLLLFDKSSSMLRDWNGKTRWQVANESLRAALDPVLDQLTIGVIRFPLGGYCGVTPFGAEGQIDFTSGRGFLTQWRSMEHRLPSEGTPLEKAIFAADLAITQAEAQGRLAGRFRVVLATDGEPTCSDDMNAAIRLVAAWYERGIETVVFGLPGSYDGTENLDALAAAGGTGTVTLVSSQEELNEGFANATQ